MAEYVIVFSLGIVSSAIGSYVGSYVASYRATWRAEKDEKEG